MTTQHVSDGNGDAFASSYRKASQDGMDMSCAVKNSVARTVMNLAINQQPHGRPKTLWLDCIKNKRDRQLKMKILITIHYVSHISVIKMFIQTYCSFIKIINDNHTPHCIMDSITAHFKLSRSIDVALSDKHTHAKT